MQSNKIEPKRTNDIAVEQVTLFDGKVSIDYYLPEWSMTKELVIDEHKYEKHLKDILALDWSFQVTEGNVYKDDVEGTMSLAEYFADVDFQQHNKDAVSYLQMYHVEHEELADVAKAAKHLKRQIETFPNPKTYPVPSIHPAHIAMMYGKVEDL